MNGNELSTLFHSRSSNGGQKGVLGAVFKKSPAAAVRVPSVSGDTFLGMVIVDVVFEIVVDAVFGIVVEEELHCAIKPSEYICQQTLDSIKKTMAGCTVNNCSAGKGGTPSCTHLS